MKSEQAVLDATPEGASRQDKVRALTLYFMAINRPLSWVMENVAGSSKPQRRVAIRAAEQANIITAEQAIEARKAYCETKKKED